MLREEREESRECRVKTTEKNGGLGSFYVINMLFSCYRRKTSRGLLSIESIFDHSFVLD